MTACREAAEDRLLKRTRKKKEKKTNGEKRGKMKNSNLGYKALSNETKSEHNVKMHLFSPSVTEWHLLLQSLLCICHYCSTIKENVQ